MNSNEVKSEILNLSGQILLGKTDKDEIKRVTKLAIDNKETDFLRKEFESVSKILAGTK